MGNGIWDRFDIGHLKEIKYPQQRPTRHTLKAGAPWPAPDLVCTFVGRRGHESPVWGSFLKPGISPHIFTSSGMGGDLELIADAIGTAQRLHFFPPADALDSFQSLASLCVDTIAAYQASIPMQKRYPWIRDVLTRQTPNGGYIYLLSDQQGHYKIGRSVNVDNRVKQLRTQPPFDIQILSKAWVPDCKFEEKRLHQQYNEWRMRGEWFDLHNELLIEIQEEIEGLHGLGEPMFQRYCGHQFTDWREMTSALCPWYMSIDEANQRDREFLAQMQADVESDAGLIM